MQPGYGPKSECEPPPAARGSAVVGVKILQPTDSSRLKPPRWRSGTPPPASDAMPPVQAQSGRSRRRLPGGPTATSRFPLPIASHAAWRPLSVCRAPSQLGPRSTTPVQPTRPRPSQTRVGASMRWEAHASPIEALEEGRTGVSPAGFAGAKPAGRRGPSPAKDRTTPEAPEPLGFLYASRRTRLCRISSTSEPKVLLGALSSTGSSVASPSASSRSAVCWA